MDKREALESLDGHAGLRNALRMIALEKEHWAGIPMPLDNEQLVVEPTYPHADGLMRMGAKVREVERIYVRPGVGNGEIPKAKMRGHFWSCARRSEIVIFEEDGRIQWGLVPGIHHLDHDLHTLGCADAWGIEQESAAIHLLANLATHRQFKHYMLTGSFLEKSPRSHVTYLFRRLRPTVAMHSVEDQMRVLCALCLHPIAYYSGSWAGAMCPTDDVIAHLMLMRGDERLFWARSNQHPAYRPEAGL